MENNQDAFKLGVMFIHAEFLPKNTVNFHAAFSKI
jgi:hypothetical protein